MKFAALSFVLFSSLNAFASAADVRGCTNQAGQAADAFLSAQGKSCTLETLPPELGATLNPDVFTLGFQYSCGYVYVPVSMSNGSCQVGEASF